MDFEKLLKSLIEPGEDGPSPTIYDDLRTSYGDAVGGGQAKLGEADAQIATLTAEVARLKGINFDLMMAVGTNEPEAEGSDNGNGESAEVTDDDIFGGDK